MQEQREQTQEKQKREARRRQLDESLRLKLKRLAREQQEELELDMSILQQMLRQETDEKRGLAQKKVQTQTPRNWHGRCLYLWVMLTENTQTKLPADKLLQQQKIL